MGNPLASRRSLQEACDTLVDHARVSSSRPYGLHPLPYHFAFIPKYRKPVLRGDVGLEVRDLIREICRNEDIEILQGTSGRTTCICC
jgi:Transposase IS200 like